MVRWKPVVSVLVVALILPGCFGKDKAPAPVTDETSRDTLPPPHRAEPEDPALQRALHDARIAVPPTQAPTWFVLESTTHPAGSVASYVLPIPDFAHIHDAFDEPTVGLEVVPILPPGKEDVRVSWNLLSFSVTESEAKSLGYLIQQEVKVHTDDGTVVTLAPDRSPHRFDLRHRYLEGLEPERVVAYNSFAIRDLGLVLTARADEVLPFGLAVRFLAEPASAAEASDSLQDFLSRVGERDPATLAPHANTTGYAVSVIRFGDALGAAMRTLGNDGYGPFAFVRTGDVAVPSCLPTPGTAPVCVVDFRFGLDTKAGWTRADGRQSSLSTDVGTWEIVWDIHGVKGSERGLTTPWGGTFYGGDGVYANVGGYGFAFVHQGKGPSSLRIQSTGTATQGLDGLSLAYLALGARVSTLFDVAPSVVDQEPMGIPV